jgi:hypothetical protein
MCIRDSFGVAPDGTTSADRVQIPGCSTGGSYSLVLQDYTGSVATWATSMFIKGTSGSGNILLISLDATLVSGLFVSCAYNSSTWTWCGGPGAPLTKAFANAASRVYLGCDNNSGAVVGTTDTGVADVLVWNVQAEAGAFPTNPIATTSATVTRAIDANAINGASFPAAPFSVSAYMTTEFPSGLGLNGAVLEGQVGSASGAGFFYIAGFLRLQTLNAGSQNISSTPTVVAGNTYRVGGVNSGGNSSLYFGGALVAGPTAKNNTAAPWSGTTGIGYAPAAPFPANGIISRVCLDSSTTRCVP